MWPNLLSLDAPVVAVLWQRLFARCFQVPVDSWAALLLLSTVWLIYAADRMLDSRKRDFRSPRHEFYKRRRRQLLPLWIAVLGVTAWMAELRIPTGLFWRGAFLLGAVALYFALVHGGMIVQWPKEAAVGILFALGASLVAWGKVESPADAATIVLFSGLCWMNCIAIQRWEGDRLDWSPRAAGMALGSAAALLLCAHRPILGGAELASVFAFLLLNRARPRLSADAVRVLADVALLSPVFFLPIAGG